MGIRRWRGVYVLLAIFIAVSFTYQVLQCVSFVIGFYDLRNQVKAPFEVAFDRSAISKVSEEAKTAGLAIGDTIESLNGIPFRGRALWQSIRWHAQVGDLLRVDVREANGAQAKIVIPLVGERSKGAQGILNPVFSRESLFLIFMLMAVPLFCLSLGYWVALARPHDLNAWLILVLLSYPEAFVSVATHNWLPGAWLVLRLNWHITLEVLAPCALAWLGLLFPERSKVDLRLPWLKWLLLVIFSAGLVVGLMTDYCAWYDTALVKDWPGLDASNDRVLNWVALFSIGLYWFALFQKLSTSSSPDARRRLRVLCAGSVVGLGSVLVIFGLLPRLGIADPTSTAWLGYLSASLLIIFPLSLAYVVIVQRAMDLPILIRMGTRYLLARTTLVVLQVAFVLLIIWRFLVPVVQHPDGAKWRLVLPVLAIAAIVSLIATRRSPGERVRVWLDRKFFREAYDAELVLGELAERARTIADPQTLIEMVMQRIADVLHVSQIAVLLRSGNTFRLRHAVGLDTSLVVILPEDAGVVKQLEQTNTPAVVYGGAAPSGDGERVVQNMTADVLLPLPGRSKLMGVMALGSKQSEEPYAPSDLRLLKSVGLQTGLALEVSALAQSLADETARRARSEREIEIAHEVQQRLFPQRYPQVEGLSLAGACRPAQGVGGDYYDAIELPGGRVGIAIGDVAGKGISAALIMAGIRSSLRTLTLEPSLDLGVMMQKLNRLVFEASAANRYATFFFAVYDPQSRHLNYVNAGHNPPFVLRPSTNGCFTKHQLDGGGTVVGLLPETAYEEQRLTLECGDVVFAYTDGISEAMTDSDEEWGEERMLEAAERACGQGAQQMLASMFQAADQFTASAPQHDDMTMLIAKLM